LPAFDWYAGTAHRFTFMRDYVLNNHWTPRGASVVGIIGMILVLLAAFYYVAEVRRYRMTWLVTLGRTALILYFLHQLIVLTLVNQHLGVRFNNWWRYGLANLALMAALLGIGRLWLAIKKRWALSGRPPFVTHRELGVSSTLT
jgi:fucose 4-O-acetylase-like acetyltransferase